MKPKTEKELEQWMKENCYNLNSYSINGNVIYEGFGIDKIGGQFIWYYIERGQKNNLQYFRTEKELIEYAYVQMKSDKWAKTHCIGFTTDKDESKDLTKELHRLGIEFLQDEIPYYGPDKPVYRTFVFGCDCNKVNDLKMKYYKQK